MMLEKAKKPKQKKQKKNKIQSSSNQSVILTMQPKSTYIQITIRMSLTP